MLTWTGERYVPWLDEATLGYEHWHRYAYAAEFSEAKTVLDLACGEGYGSYLLAQRAHRVLGIDIDEQTISHANGKYLKANLQFKVGSVTEIPIEGRHLFDLIVCFEAIEHIDAHDRLLNEVKRLLAPDGIFILSTPNKSAYSDEPQYTNPFHVQELYFGEFRSLMEKYFRHVNFLGQRIYCSSQVWPLHENGSAGLVEHVVERPSKEFLFTSSEKKVPLYFIALATDQEEMPCPKISLLTDSSNTLLAGRTEEIKQLATEREHWFQKATGLSAEIHSQQQALAEKEREVLRLQLQVEDRARAVDQKETEALRLRAEWKNLADQLEQKSKALRQEQKENAKLYQAMENLERQLEEFRTELRVHQDRTFYLEETARQFSQQVIFIEESLAWMLTIRYRRWRDRIFPQWTRRRMAYDSVRDQVKILLRDGWGALWLSIKATRAWPNLSEFLHERAYTSVALRSIPPCSQKIDHSHLHDGLRWMPEVEIRGSRREAFFMHPPAHVSYTLRIPKNSSFESYVALMPDVWARNPGGVEFELTLTTKNGRDHRVWKRLVHPTARRSHRRWVKFTADLGRFAESETQLTLATHIPRGATADFAWAIWGDPAVVCRSGLWQTLKRSMAGSKFYDLRNSLRMLPVATGSLRAQLGAGEESMLGKAAGPSVFKPNSHPLETPKREYPALHLPTLPVLKSRLRLFLSNRSAKFVFPRFRKPLVSIVIPSFNKAAYLYQCLDSILTHSDLPFEVVLVDDGSNDETPSLVKKLENAQLFRNEQNLGFLRSSNVGAKSGRGRFILFLNNDILATSGWLSALVGTMDAYPKCGAVGAKLLQPDGKLQEAGSIIWLDGSASAYGAADDPEKSQYCYTREVDYCSAACLLVRSDLVKQLGGFDERYSPAYYEDADLCFGIRQLGFTVLYQPQATVYHYGSQSYSLERATVLTSANRPRFLQKWGEEVRRNGLPRDGLLRARDRRQGRRVLVMDDRIPAPHLGSGLPRSHKLLEMLCELGFAVTFLPLTDPTPHEPATRQLQQLGVEVFFGNRLNLRELFRSRSGYYDVVIVSRPHNGAQFLEVSRDRFPHALLVYDAEALYSRREALRATAEGKNLNHRERDRMLKREIQMMQRADAIVAVSETEREIILREGTDRPVFVWGFTHAVTEPRMPFYQRRDLLFVGGFLDGNPPNTDAVLYFAQRVFPAIRTALPECRFVIVGSQPPPSILQLASPDIVVTGFVRDLKPYYEQCRLAVVPLRYGAGINHKLTEAMSYGIPAVASTVAASGLGLRDGQETLIAADEKDFVKKIVQLYTDELLWTTIQRNAQNYIREHCSPSTMKARLSEILDQERPTARWSMADRAADPKYSSP